MASVTLSFRERSPWSGSSSISKSVANRPLIGRPRNLFPVLDPELWITPSLTKVCERMAPLECSNATSIFTCATSIFTCAFWSTSIDTRVTRQYGVLEYKPRKKMRPATTIDNIASATKATGGKALNNNVLGRHCMVFGEILLNQMHQINSTNSINIHVSQVFCAWIKSQSRYYPRLNERARFIASQKSPPKPLSMHFHSYLPIVLCPCFFRPGNLSSASGNFFPPGNSLNVTLAN